MCASTFSITSQATNGFLCIHVIIFDEAQRAWDKGKVERRHKGSVVGSEPDMFIGMANRIPDWGAVVGLIGTGQEIHEGIWTSAMGRCRVQHGHASELGHSCTTGHC